MSDERAQQLEERLIEETQRLEKLYVAYRRLEEELQEKNAVIDVLEKEAIDKEIEREGLQLLHAGERRCQLLHAGERVADVVLVTMVQCIIDPVLILFAIEIEREGLQLLQEQLLLGVLVQLPCHLHLQRRSSPSSAPIPRARRVYWKGLQFTGWFLVKTPFSIISDSVDLHR